MVEARKRTLGEEHPHTLLSIQNLEVYLTSLLKQTQSQDLVFRSALQPEQQVEGKRSRWSLKSLVKRNHVYYIRFRSDLITITTTLSNNLTTNSSSNSDIAVKTYRAFLDLYQ